MNIHDIVATGKKATRDGYGEGIFEAGKRNKNVIAMVADLLGSLKLEQFIEAFPDRFVQMGIGEANMMGVAAGLATAARFHLPALSPISPQDVYMTR
ncbi:MAG: transketolase [Candidatus Parvibacillus calidus]|nr:MAG: transketolase [Candidatus Parvibacillus calidus]